MPESILKRKKFICVMFLPQQLIDKILIDCDLISEAIILCNEYCKLKLLSKYHFIGYVNNKEKLVNWMKRYNITIIDKHLYFLRAYNMMRLVCSKGKSGLVFSH